MSEGFVLIDVGNTRSKWLLAGAAGVLARGAAPSEAIPTALPEAGPGALALVASVASSAADDALRARLRAAGYESWFAGSLAALDGLTSGYAQPDRLGTDRWLAMLGALQRCRGRRFCVVDAGSALTIDIVDASGQHEGGYILPGRRLMERALQADTERVRYTAAGTEVAPGHSTAEAVGGGIGLALIGAVRCALAEAQGHGPVDVLLLCGGDAAALAPFLDNAVLAPDLVFEGLLRQAYLSGVAVPPRLPF